MGRQHARHPSFDLRGHESRSKTLDEQGRTLAVEFSRDAPHARVGDQKRLASRCDCSSVSKTVTIETPTIPRPGRLGTRRCFWTCVAMIASLAALQLAA